MNLGIDRLDLKVSAYNMVFVDHNEGGINSDETN